MGNQSATITLISPDHVPEDARRFFDLTPDSVYRTDGMIYLQTGHDVLCCTDTDAGNRLMAAINGKKAGEMPEGRNNGDIWYQFITLSEAERIEGIAEKHGITVRKTRNVVFFHAECPYDIPLVRVFRSIAPLEADDHTVSIDYQTMVLIKESALCSEEETAEYAAAVIDTMANEGFTGLRAGIGTEAAELSELRNRFREAREALSTGIRFHPNETLFIYSRQRLERIIDLIPSDNRKRIVREFQSRCDGDAFSEDIMETVRVFFQHDLSIASASRQLFIHRNTLNYRLDKIKRETGLDLRVFNDAVVFRLVFEMADKAYNDEGVAK